jgi:hypothetical protein
MGIIKLIFVDTLLDILYFPVWWYSRGMVLAFKWVVAEIMSFENLFGLRIWIKNIFHPMFSQHDWQGKIISFFMRIFQIIFRTVALAGVSVFYFILFLAYLVLPVFIIWGIGTHLPAVLR